MTQDIESIGLSMDTSGVEKAIKSLETLAATGPKVEKSMGGVEGAATRVNKSLATLGQGNAANGLSTVARASDTAATSVEKVGDAAAKSAREIGSIDSAAGGAGSSLAGLSTAAGLAARAMAAIGIGASVGEFVKMADASTNVASRLGLVTSSAAELASVQQRLFSIAQSSRVSFVDLVGTYAQVARSTKDLGVSQTALLGVIQTISQAVTISGGSAASAQAALTQLSQGFASGALRGEELNSVMEQTPRLAQAIADGMGVSVGKLRELGQAGELTSEKVLGALEKSAAGVAAEFGKMAMTVEQASTNAANSALKLVGALDKITGASSAIAGGISHLSAGMDSLTLNIERLSKSKGLSDFFFLAFNNERSLNGELAITQKELAQLEARLAKAPSNIYTRSAVVEMREYVKELKEAQARLAALSGQSGPTDPRDQTGFTGRGASYANEAKRLAKLREDANAFRLKQDGVPESYLKDMAELIRLNQAGVIVGKEYTDALKRQQDELLKKTGATKGATSAATAEQNTYESLIASIRTKIGADKAELAGSVVLTESQRLRIKLEEELASGKLRLTDAHKKQALAALDELAIEERIAAESKAALKVSQERQQFREKEAGSIAAFTAAQEAAAAQALRSVNDRVTSLQDEQAAVIMATSLNISLAEAIERVALERLREKQAGFADGSDGWQDIEREIQARKQLIDMVAGKNQREEEARGWADMWQSVDRTAHDVFVNVLEGGQDAFERLGKTLKATVLDVLYQMTVRKWIINIGTGIFGSGFGAAASAATGGGAGGALSAIGSIGSGYSLLSGIGGTFGGGLSAGFGGLMGSLGLSATGSTLGGALSAGGIALQSGNIMGGLGTIAGALGPIALGIGLLTSFIKKPTPHSGAGVTYSAAGGLTSGASQYTKTNYGFGAAGEYSAESNTAVASVAKGIATALDSTAVAFGKKAGFEISTAFADDKGKDGAWGQLAIKLGGQKVLDWRDTQTSKWAPKEFADGEAGLKEYQAAVAASMRDALSSLDLPGWVNSVLQDLGDAPALEDMEKALSSIAQANDAMAALGSQIGGLSGLSDEAKASLIDAFGGVETFAATASEYANVVLTDAEKVSLSMTDISSQFEALGMAVPSSVSALQDLISAQDLTTDAGREAVASLMTLGTSFATVMDQMQQSIGLTGDSLKSVFQNVLKQAHSAEEARVMGEQAAGQLLMDAIGNALVGTVTDLVSNAVLQPITQSIVGAAAQAATMDVAAASTAGATLAAGGAAGATTIAAGSAAGATSLAAGGAAGGANVAAGGAAAGQGLADIVGKAISVTNAMVDIMNNADFQTAFGNAVSAIGSISGTLFKGMTSIQTSMPGFAGGGSAAISSGGGGGGSSSLDNKNPLDDLLAERRQLEIQLMKAQGKEEEALAEIRKDAIKGLEKEAIAAWDYNRALEKQIEQANQLASLQEDRSSLQIAMLQAQGREEEALALIRAQAIKGMSKEAIALYDANKAMEEQIRVIESLADFAKAGKELRAELLALEGNATGASALLRELAIEGLTAIEIAAYDANEALKKQISTLKERQSLEDKLADLLGDSTAKRKRERDAIDESNRAIYDRITAIEDSKTAAQAALSALEKSVQAEKDKLAEDYNAQVKGLQERVSSIGEVVRDLDAALKSVRGTLESTTEQSQAAARLTLQSVLSAVNSGASVSSFGSVISQAAGTLSKNDTSSYTDRASFVRAQAKSGDLLHALNAVGGAQLTTAEMQLETLEDWRDDELRRLDSILENARTQLDAAYGTQTGILSLGAAMAGFSAAVAALSAAMRGTATSGSSGILLPPGTIVSRPFDELPRYAGGGYYGGGLALVGESGPELINFDNPGMVYTAQQTGQILDNREVVAELRAVRRELAAMKAEARRTADAVNGRPEQPMLVETVA